MDNLLEPEVKDVKDEKDVLAPHIHGSLVEIVVMDHQILFWPEFSGLSDEM